MTATEEGITLLMEAEPPEQAGDALAPERRQRALTETEMLQQALSPSPSSGRRAGGGTRPRLSRTLSGQGRDLVLENRKSAGESDDDDDTEARRDSDLLKIHVASWNVGNAAPPVDLKQWIPEGGGGADIVAVCVQEATYSESDAAEDAIGTMEVRIKRITAVDRAGPQVLTCEAKVQSDVPNYTRQSFATTAARSMENEPNGDTLEWLPVDPPSGRQSHTTFNVFSSTARLKMHLSDEATLMKTMWGVTTVELRVVDGLLQVRPSSQSRGFTEEGVRAVAESSDGWVPCSDGDLETELTTNGKSAGMVVLQLRWRAEAMTEPSAGVASSGTPQRPPGMPSQGQLRVVLHDAEGLRACDSNGLSDPYASMTIHTPQGPQQKQKTEVCKGTLSPVWESTHSFDLPADATSLRIVLKDYDDISVGGVTLGKGVADVLGYVTLQAAHLRTFTSPRTDAFPVNHNSKRKGSLRMTAHFRVSDGETPDLDLLHTDARDGLQSGSEPEPEPEIEPEPDSDPYVAVASHSPVNIAGDTARTVGDGLHAVGKQGIRSLAEALNTNAVTAGWAGDGDSHFFKRVMNQLGPEYHVVGHEAVGHSGSGNSSQVMQFTLMQMRIIIMAKAAVLPYTTNWQLSWQATGIGGVVANKGGIVAKFDYHDTSLCFVCAHLAAHQGAKHRLQRNEMAQTVHKTARVGNKNIDIGNQYDHVFWAGDLNYRIDLPEADGQTRTHKEQLDEVSELIARLQNSHQQLHQADELQREIKQGRVFAGWNDSLSYCVARGHNDCTRDREGMLLHDAWTFAPTFKTKRAVSFGYNPQRVPSFTDRILWRSSPGREQCLELLKFCPEFEVCTSDHKPVYAVFRLSVPRPLRDRTAEFNGGIGGQQLQRQLSSRCVAMKLVSLSVEGLDNSLTGGEMPNPRCQLYVQHKSELISDERNTSDPIMQSTPRMTTVSPAWSADDLPVVIFDCPDISLLGGFCESPKALHEQNGANFDGAASTDQSVASAGQLRIGYAESVVLRFSSVPEGYDSATSAEKAVANAKQRLVGPGGLTAGHVHQELGNCRIALRDYEPGVERRTAPVSKAKAFSLQRQHENSSGAIGTTVPQGDNVHISRSFECELSLNGVGRKGRVKGQLELYHVDSPNTVDSRKRPTGGSGTDREGISCILCSCCASRPGKK